MTGKSLWQQLKEVADCDKKIAELIDEIARIKNGILKDNQLNAQKENLVATKERSFIDTQKSLHTQELTLKELKISEDKKRAQLDTIKNQKEYKALEKEIADLARQRAKLDEEALKVLYAVDELKKELDDLRTSATESTMVRTHDQHIKEENLAQLMGKHEKAVTQRELTLQNVPAEWRTQYERMRATVTDPIVPVLNGSCGACFYTILHQDLSKLKKSQVVVCRSCYRFLYYEAEAAKDAGKAEY
jgi:uncharacterized protein